MNFAPKTLDPPPRESFWEYREAVRQAFRRAAGPVAADKGREYDPAPAVTPLDERLIQAVWRSQMLATDSMRLADSTPVRVLDPGQWTGMAGPDFRQARLMIGSELVTGDVEMHLDASLWRSHGHDRDMDYNGVVLHVVFRIDDGEVRDTLHSGATIPRLELEPYLFPDLETIQRSITPDDFSYERPAGLGRCYDLMTGSDGGLILDFLDRAGDERLESKIRRLEEQTRSGDMEQVLHQSVMMTLGSGAAKSLYYLLARRTPMAEVRDFLGEFPAADRRAGFESLLIHLARLEPAPGDEAGDESEEAARYLARIKELWARLEPFWSDRRMAPTKKWYRGIRPVNFPARRLSAAALVHARYMEKEASLLEDLVRRALQWAPELEKAVPAKKVHPAIRELVSIFEVEDPSSFWAARYSFAARPAPRPMKLLGASAARSVVFNAVIPALALAGRMRGDATLERAARRLYAIFPVLQANHITEFMTHRLFGDSDRAKNFISTERRRQALFQIFHACCMNDQHNCDGCHYMKDG